MAREVVTKCDKCGLPGEDVETYRLTMPDGLAFEVDLDAEHGQPFLELAKLGRQVQAGLRRPDSNNSALEGRIRGLD